MALTKLAEDLNIVSALDNEPNDVTGLTAEQLKAKFDEAGNKIKTYINNTLTTEADDSFATKAEVQDVVLGQIPDGSLMQTKFDATLSAKIDGAIQPEDMIDNNVSVSPDVATALGLTGNPQVKDALMRVAPWRLLKVYDVAGAYTFNPADYPNITELGVFIVGGGGSGQAQRENNTNCSGGASGRTRCVERKSPFPTSFNLVVGAGGSARNATTSSLDGLDGTSSSFDGIVANGGRGGIFSHIYTVAGGQTPIKLMQGPVQEVQRTPFAFGEVFSTTQGYGGTTRQESMMPNECYNPFDRKRLLIAGGSAYMQSSPRYIYQESIMIEDDYGNSASVSAISRGGNPVNAIAVKGTSYGCGGGGASMVGAGITTSAAGCDGAVLIYGR